MEIILAILPAFHLLDLNLPCPCELSDFKLFEVINSSGQAKPREF